MKEALVKYLVEYGADINEKNICGEMIGEIDRGNETLVEYLVEHRADIN